MSIEHKCCRCCCCSCWALIVSGVIFSIFSLVHLYRIFVFFPVVINTFVVPEFASVVVFFVAAFMAVWNFWSASKVCHCHCDSVSCQKDHVDKIDKSDM